MSEWQPIETAPRDGSLIDVWFSADPGYRETDVKWTPTSDGRQKKKGAFGGRREDYEDNKDPTWCSYDRYFAKWIEIGEPTHWRPLPAPPRRQKMSGYTASDDWLETKRASPISLEIIRDQEQKMFTALYVEAIVASLFGSDDGDPDIIYTLHGKRPRLRFRVRRALEAANVKVGL